MPRALRSFSLQRFIAASAQQLGVPLRQLGRVDRALEPATPGVFDASVHAMRHWCRLNEQLLLERHAKHARVLVGFERLSRVRPVIDTYRRIASAVDQLTLFAVHDERLQLDATLVDVSGGPLEREWFLVIDAPSYKALLVARDQQGFGPTGPLAGRRFEGACTHDTKLVAAATEALAALK